MTESQWTSRLLQKLRKHPDLANAVVWKHANPYAKGIPDFSVTIGPRTHWYEVKLQGNRVTEIQQYYLDRIGAQGAFVIVVAKDGRGATVQPLVALGYMSVNELVEEIAARIII